MPEFTKYKFDNFVARRVELTEVRIFNCKLFN